MKQRDEYYAEHSAIENHTKWTLLKKKAYADHFSDELKIIEVFNPFLFTRRFEIQFLKTKPKIEFDSQAQNKTMKKTVCFSSCNWFDLLEISIGFQWLSAKFGIVV